MLSLQLSFLICVHIYTPTYRTHTVHSEHTHVHVKDTMQRADHYCSFVFISHPYCFPLANIVYLLIKYWAHYLCSKEVRLKCLESHRNSKCLRVWCKWRAETKQKWQKQHFIVETTSLFKAEKHRQWHYPILISYPVTLHQFIIWTM